MLCPDIQQGMLHVNHEFLVKEKRLKFKLVKSISNKDFFFSNETCKY